MEFFTERRAFSKASVKKLVRKRQERKSNMLIFIPECLEIITHHSSVFANYVPPLPFEMGFFLEWFFFVDSFFFFGPKAITIIIVIIQAKFPTLHCISNANSVSFSQLDSQSSWRKEQRDIMEMPLQYSDTEDPKDLGTRRGSKQRKLKRKLIKLSIAAR